MKPNFFVTAIDNDVLFYLIAERVEGRSIAVQNGRRGYDVEYMAFWIGKLRRKQKFRSSIYAAWGQSSVDLMSSVLDADFVVCGSPKLNYFASRNAQRKEKTAVVFSDFRPPDAVGEWNHHGYYLPEITQFDFLVFRLNDLGFSVRIAGSMTQLNFVEQERKFYQEVISSGRSWTYLPKTGDGSSYRELNSANLSVAWGSSMGLEAVAAGGRVAILFARNPLFCPAVIPKNNSLKGSPYSGKTDFFGYPDNLPLNGPFWTSFPDQIEIDRVLRFAHASSEERWLDAMRRFKLNRQCIFDPGNRRLKSLLRGNSRTTQIE